MIALPVPGQTSVDPCFLFLFWFHLMKLWILSSCRRSTRPSTVTGVVFSLSSSKTKCNTNSKTTAAFVDLLSWKDCRRGQRSAVYDLVDLQSVNTLWTDWNHINTSVFVSSDCWRLHLQVTIRTYGKFRPPISSAGGWLLQTPPSLVQPIHIKTEPQRHTALSRSLLSPIKRPVNRRVNRWHVLISRMWCLCDVLSSLWRVVLSLTCCPLSDVSPCLWRVVLLQDVIVWRTQVGVFGMWNWCLWLVGSLPDTRALSAVSVQQLLLQSLRCSYDTVRVLLVHSDTHVTAAAHTGSSLLMSECWWLFSVTTFRAPKTKLFYCTDFLLHGETPWSGIDLISFMLFLL